MGEGRRSCCSLRTALHLASLSLSFILISASSIRSSLSLSLLSVSFAQYAEIRRQSAKEMLPLPFFVLRTPTLYGTLNNTQSCSCPPSLSLSHAEKRIHPSIDGSLSRWISGSNLSTILFYCTFRPQRDAGMPLAIREKAETTPIQDSCPEHLAFL